MWARFGITLGMSILVASCGSGGSSGSSGSTSPSPSQSQATSGSFENVSLEVDFPVDGSLSTESSIAFTGRVGNLANYSGAQIRVTTATNSYTANLNGEAWSVEGVPLSASDASSYQVDLLVDNELVKSEILELGYDEGFYPFSIGDALALNDSDNRAYLLDGNQIIEVEVLSGVRSLALELPQEVGAPDDIVWLPSSESILLINTAGDAYPINQSGSNWYLGESVSGVSADKVAVSDDGGYIYAYNHASQTLDVYNANFVLLDGVSLSTVVSYVDDVSYLSSEAILLANGEDLVLVNPDTQSATSLPIDDLDLGSIGGVTSNLARDSVYVRSASKNELWQLDLDLGASPGYVANQIDLGITVSYAMEFSDAEDSLLFSSPNRLNALDPQTQALSVVSDLGWGAGAEWVAPASLAISESSMQAYVSDLATDDIYQIDMETGFRAALNTNGESMEAVTGMVQNGSNLYSVDWVKKSVLMTDVDSGLTSDLMIDQAGQPDLSEPIAIDLDADRLRAFVLDRGLRAIYEIDTSSGNALVVADSEDATALTLAKGLSFDETDQSIYWSSWLDNSLHRLNLNTLQSDLISGQTRGTGQNFGRPGAIALNASGSVAYVLDALDGKIFSVDLNTGERRVASDSKHLSHPESIAFDTNRNVLNVLDAGSRALYALDPESGSLVLISM